MSESLVLVDGRELRLTNLEKVIWPEGFTKAHLIKYYSDIAPYILPYLYNRPVVMKRYPDGIEGEYFYQKECPEYAPEWIKTQPVRHSDKVVNYVICNDAATLIWLANQACIEMHAWLARLEDLERPDLAIIDLDPAGGASFEDVLQTAVLCRHALKEFRLECFPKTSGARGLHLFIPLKPVYSWQEVTAAMRYVSELVVRAYPDQATTERKVEKRGAKVYLDYLQNGRGKTMAFQYGLRPLPGAPASTPLHWSEVERGSLRPGDFTIETIFKRLDSDGDIYSRMISLKQSLDGILMQS